MENNHPSFFGESWHRAAAAFLAKPQGHFQAVVLLALSTHIFRSTAFSPVRVKYFPTFAPSSFQMPEMETAVAIKQQHSHLLWISDTNRCCPWKPNWNHHMGVNSMFYATHYPTGLPDSKTPQTNPSWVPEAAEKPRRNSDTLMYIYTHMCICLLTCIYTSKYICTHREKLEENSLLAFFHPNYQHFSTHFLIFSGRTESEKNSNHTDKPGAWNWGILRKHYFSFRHSEAEADEEME